MTTDDEPRRRLSANDRLSTIERDLRDHAKTLSVLIDDRKSFSSEQMDQLRDLLRDELGDAGLRLDEADHIDEARRDFNFLRALRKGANGVASKIGWFIIAAVLGGAVWLFMAGLQAWRAAGGAH